jgi:hypothetical protein
MPLLNEPARPTWNDGVAAGERAPSSWTKFIRT